MEITEEDGKKVLTFIVVNETQKAWIQEKILDNLVLNIQKAVESTRVRLRVEVAPQEEKEKEIYTNHEKGTYMVNNIQQVNSLVKDLGLDTK